MDHTLALINQHFFKFSCTDRYFERCDLCFDDLISLKERNFSPHRHSIDVFDDFDNHEQQCLTHRQIFDFIDKNEFLQQISKDITAYNQQSLTTFLDIDQIKEMSISLPSNSSEKLEPISITE